MRLDVAAHLPGLILEPPHGGVEGIADRDIDILMRVVDGLRPIDHHVLPRYADIDAHAIELALVMVPVRRLDDDGTADDAVVEAL